METKFYEFNQNNSGGSFDVDDNICHRIVIEAKTENEATLKAQELGVYFNGCDDGIDCSCCGDRWYGCDEINIDEWKKKGYPVGVYEHYKDAESRWNILYGEFPLIEKPKWQDTYSSKEYKGKIYFKDIEQYCQFMANSYGCTTPDIRIFYLNGDKKEIFKVEIE